MSMPPLNRLQIAWRAAQDITDGMLVNLGLGMPLFVADYLRPEVDVFMEHVTRQGAPRLLDTCVLPLTAVRCVKRVYTDLAVIDIMPAGMVVREMLGGLSEADLRARTRAPLIFAPDCRPLVAPAIALPD